LNSQLGSQLNSQLRSQLDSQLRSQLGSQLDSQLYSQLDSQLDSQLRSQLDSQLDSQLRSQLGSQLGSQLYSQLDSQLNWQLNSQLRSQLDSQLRSQLGSQLDSQLNWQLNSQLRSQLYSQLRSQLYSQLDSQLYSQRIQYVNDYLFTLNIYSSCLFTWWNFIANELNIKAPIKKELEMFSSAYEKSNIYSAIFTEAVCIVSKFPKAIHRNSNNDLHSTNESAVEWASFSDLTKWECFYVNGRLIDKQIFSKVVENKMTFEEFVKIQNEDEKGIIISMIKENKGNEGLLNFLQAVEVDSKTIRHTKDYSETIKLFKTKQSYSFLQNSKGELNQPYAWIHMVCPSTRTEYLIDTCPTFTDAIECAKWHRPKQVPKELKYEWISAN